MLGYTVWDEEYTEQSPTGWCPPVPAQSAKSGGSAKTGQATLKMATRVGDLLHHLHSSKKRSFAPLPPYINCCLILGGITFIMAHFLPLDPTVDTLTGCCTVTRKCVAQFYSSAQMSWVTAMANRTLSVIVGCRYRRKYVQVRHVRTSGQKHEVCQEKQNKT